tara:strand:+ start:343 stop:1074 length:732 start_codon:yes stop_codon:yes gene_type:complete
MGYVQKNSPLKQDAKFMTKQYDKTRQNMSASGEKAFKKGQSEAAIAAASFVPITKVLGGVVNLAKGITNLSKASKTVKAMGTRGVRNTRNPQVARRLEDVNTGTPRYNKAGKLVKTEHAGKTGIETNNWATTSVNSAKYYNKNTKNSQRFTKKDPSFLSKEEPRRLIEMNVTRNFANKTRAGNFNPSSTAHNISGGVGNPPVYSELVLPQHLMQAARAGKTPWSKTIIGNSKDINKYLNKSNK